MSKSHKLKWLDRTVVLGPRLVLCTTEHQFKKAIKYLCVMPEEGWSTKKEACVHTFDEAWGLACVVCMPADKKRTFAVTAAILAHEAVHVAQRLFLRIGEDYPSKEFQAYVIENVTRNLIEDYLRQTK